MSNTENSKEFIASESITLNLRITPETNDLLREWSLSIPTLYLLDICVVSATKLTSAALEKNKRKKDLVTRLQELDRPNNGFSYLFALMEKVSDSRGNHTDEMLEEIILSDLASLRNFFNKARIIETDDFVIKFLRKLRGNPIEQARPIYLEYITSLNNRFDLRNPKPATERLERAEDLIHYADELGLSRQHPVVVLALACLYGNGAAKKLMKFKANSELFNAENVLADISLITRFAGVKLEIEQIGRNRNGPYARSNYITDDEGLINILKCFSPMVVKHFEKPDGRDVQTTMTVDLRALLTEIGDEDFEYMLNVLNT